MRRNTLAALVMVLEIATARGGVPSAPLPLQTVFDIPLGGQPTRLDYASLDSARHLLFIAHLGDSTVIVVATAARKVVARIPGISHVHGVLAIPELGIVYASATGTDEVVAIDEDSLKVTARVPGGVYPDGMAYAPEAHKLYVSDEHGATETVIDTVRNVRIATIPLGGEVGNSQYDARTRRIFANVQTTGELVELDPATDHVVSRTLLPGAKGNHGLLIDPFARRAYIACEDNHRLLVLDLETRRIIFSADTGADPDVLDLDAAEHRLYVAAESGDVAIFGTDGGSVRHLGTWHLARKAHVVAIDRASHDIYFPLENVDGRTVLRILSPTHDARSSRE